MNKHETVTKAIESVDLDLAVELCQEVSRIPSVLGEEGPLADFFVATMKDLGFESVGLQTVLPDRPNAVGEIGFGTGKRIVFTGHLDTKPVSHGWEKTDPFSGDLIDGAVYGHGIMDMKAALACQLVAISGLANSGGLEGGTLAFAAVSDHMGDQQGSIAYFNEYTADLCVLGELTDNNVAIGHRGRYYFDIHVFGKSAHTIHKDKAINANYLAAIATIELDQSHLEPSLDISTAALFGKETFMVPGRIYGGLPPGGPSMIPDECVIRVDCRPQPGVSVGVVRAEIDRCLARAAQIDPRFRADVVLVDEKPGYLIERDSEVVGNMVEALNNVRGEASDAQVQVEGWLGDTASFGQKVPTVIFGPGGEPVYSADEHLSVTDIHEAAQAYAAFAAISME